MKINEIITEDIGADPSQLEPHQLAAFAGLASMPDISMNKSNGNFYQQYRWMIATALVDKDGNAEQMPAAGAMAGDPVVAAYTDEDLIKINKAAEMVDGGRVVPLGGRKSTEDASVNKASPFQPRGPITLKRK